MTHAFFKALLFLTAGAVIVACHHEQDIRKMGGLRRQLPFEYACFLVGGLALCALPFVTAGFYSKDAILWSAYAAGNMHLVTAGMVGALLTSVYTFRLIFTVFHGQEQLHVHQRPRSGPCRATRDPARAFDRPRRTDQAASRRRAAALARRGRRLWQALRRSTVGRRPGSSASRSRHGCSSADVNS
jgi:NADH:ubiquinone oxidoreductase subunit 5 (subunit L)/multisubunit Na+/H+ antiporter MnhA subunit